MPGTKKPHATKNSMTAREMWLQAVKGRSYISNQKKGYSTTKKTPTEYWVGTLRKSQGLQSEIASMDTFGNNRPSSDSVPYLSTSHYLRERVGVERNKRPNSTTDLKASPGTPAYKTPEEYYDEVLELRKQIGGMDKDNSLLRAKLRRVEEDNNKKEREIESLMDPTKSGDLRRTLTDRKPDSSAVVHSLKQRIMRLEQQIKEKEQAISNMKSDLKSTNMDEVRLKMEMLYQEIVRLQNADSTSHPQSSNQRTARSRDTKESSSKIKALNDTILRMNEKNVKLTAENKSLKEDLEKLMNDAAKADDKQRGYDDMSRKQLASMIARLEIKMDNQKQATMGDNSSVSSFSSKKGKTDTEGKLELEGSLAERLEALDKRETELLEHIKQQNLLLKKAKDDKLFYRQKADEKLKEIKALKKEISELSKDLEFYYDKEKTTSHRASVTDGGSRRPSLRDRPPSPRERPPSARERVPSPRDRTSDKESSRDRLSSARDRPSSSSARKDRRLREIRENQAARSIQRGWRQHVQDEQELAERNKRVEKFTTNRAARKIQNQWIRHQEHQHNQELDEAAMLIQSTLRGNDARQRQLRRYQQEDEEEELNDATELIQSSVRGHWSRQKLINARSRTSSFGSEGYNTDDAAAQIQSAFRGHNARKQYINDRKSSRPPSGRSSPSQSRSRSSLKGRQSLDSAGEEETISDETPTPRQAARKQRNSFSKRQRSSPVPATVETDDDDDDIVF